ncbi:MAG TPA: PEP/pyruvate-binding domain-containing protein, partial [Chroococcales cyanobacterium]
MNILLETGPLGGKGDNLARLSELGLPVPSWFALSAAVMERMTARLELASILDVPAPPDLEEPSRLAASRILALEWPLDLREAIAERCGPFGGPVAVRSSAVGEDGKEHSFAGQFDTFLFVRGQEEVLQAIKRCWASAYSERAVAYRISHGLPHDVRMAVVIQKMIDSEVSGVLFTADPITGNRNEMILSSTWGLGEGLVSGTLDADSFNISRRSGFIDRTVVEKKQMFVPAPTGGTRIAAVPPDRISKDSLSVDQIRRLVALGEKIEAAFGAPQDIEWTIKGEDLFLLQTRPITKLPPAPPEGMKRLFDNANIVESYSGITTPLTFSFASRGYEVLYRKLAESLGAHPLDLAQNDHRFK